MLFSREHYPLKPLNIESITPANEQKMAVMFKENPKTYLYKKETTSFL